METTVLPVGWERRLRDLTNCLREPFKKKNPGISDFVRKGGGGSRPIRNSYFDLVSEDPMLTGSPNQENEQVFRWFKTCFSDENSQIKLKKIFVYQNKIRNSYRGGGSWSFGPNPKFLGFFY